VINFALEGHITGMKPAVFWKIITHDVPGGNSDPQKAERIRTFVIPSEFTVPGSSSPLETRTMKIFAAFVSERWVWVLSDFSGLVRMHIESKDRAWTAEDLAIGSEVFVTSR